MTTTTTPHVDTLTVSTPWLASAIRHLAVDYRRRPAGGRLARSVGARLAERVRRLQRWLPPRGGSLTLRPRPYDPASCRISAEIWITRGGQIEAEIALSADSAGVRVQYHHTDHRGRPAIEGVHRRAPRTDVLYRRAVAATARVRQDAADRRVARAAAWLAEQPAEVRDAYAASGARPTCLRLADRTITEALHDVGGSMGIRVTDEDLVEVLSRVQESHDRTYHDRRMSRDRDD